jgi:DNA repair photolyase
LSKLCETQNEDKRRKRAGLKVIYEPSGRAAEYGDLALNIYTGCSFGCTYCFAPAVLKKDRDTFHNSVKTRDNLLEKVEKDCKSGLIDRPVHLCFTCDPYQDIDLELQTTREVLKLFKKYNINFQMLTKGGMRAARDFDLYKPGDSFGSTLTMLPYNQYAEYFEPHANTCDRCESLIVAHFDYGIKTWVSLEPVIYTQDALKLIELTSNYVDLYKVGKLNTNNCKGSEAYPQLREIEKSADWKAFGHNVIDLLERLGKKYYIKDDLKAYL